MCKQSKGHLDRKEYWHLLIMYETLFMVPEVLIFKGRDEML